MTILFLLLLLQSGMAEAAEKLWPTEITMSQILFAPYLPNRYSDIEGLADFEGAENLNHYMLISLHPSWTPKRSCDVENRGSGYLQTVPVTNEYADYLASVGVPFFFRLETSFLGLKKEHLLNSTLLTVSILELHPEEFRLISLVDFRIPLRKLCELDPNCKPSIVDPALPVNIHFDGPLLTSPFLFRNGQEIRLRVSWSSHGICDEDSVRFKMGDQIRILATFPAL